MTIKWATGRQIKVGRVYPGLFWSIF